MGKFEENKYASALKREIAYGNIRDIYEVRKYGNMNSCFQLKTDIYMPTKDSRMRKLLIDIQRIKKTAVT